MNIVWQEIRMNKISWLSYTLGISAMFLMFMAFFDTFKESAALMDQLLKNFPPEFVAAFGFADVNLSELNGYLSFLYGYMNLIAAVFAMKLGISALSEEGRCKTTDFLLTKPVTRQSIFESKLIAVILLLFAQNAVLGILTQTSALFINSDYSVRILFLFSLSMLFTQVFFVGVGFILSVVINKIKSVMPLTLGVVFMFFIIELVNQSIMDKNLSYLTPFSYFKGAGIIKNLSLETTYTLLSLSVFVILTLTSLIIYKRKDMHAV